MHDILTIIPARGGSKRLPRKNILSLAGKPLIAWTIEAAKNARTAKTICVSTDDPEIARIATEYGADVPFLRPAELASDTATSVAVALHALDWYKSQGLNFDTMLLLQPTSPLRSSKDIDDAFELFKKNNANSVTSVCEVDHSPLWSNTLPANLSMDGFIPESVKNLRSQDLPTYYRLNGALYLVRTDVLLRERSFIASTGSFAYIMPRDRSIDIDTKLDFIVAESILSGLTGC